MMGKDAVSGGDGFKIVMFILASVMILIGVYFIAYKIFFEQPKVFVDLENRVCHRSPQTPQPCPRLNQRLSTPIRLSNLAVIVLLIVRTAILMTHCAWDCFDLRIKNAMQYLCFAYAVRAAATINESSTAIYNFCNNNNSTNMVDLQFWAGVSIYVASLLMVLEGVACLFTEFPVGLFEGIFYWYPHAVS